MSEEIDPVDMVLDISHRYTMATGMEKPLIHASNGFRKIIKYWMNSQPFWKAVENQMDMGVDMLVCDCPIRFDIRSSEVILLIK